MFHPETAECPDCGMLRDSLACREFHAERDARLANAHPCTMACCTHSIRQARSLARSAAKAAAK
jgi:hypothetical protein